MSELLNDTKDIVRLYWGFSRTQAATEFDLRNRITQSLPWVDGAKQVSDEEIRNSGWIPQELKDQYFDAKKTTGRLAQIDGSKQRLDKAREDIAAHLKSVAKTYLGTAISEGEDLKGFFVGDLGGSTAVQEILDGKPFDGASKGNGIFHSNPRSKGNGYDYDPVFGTEYHKQIAIGVGKELGLSEQQVAKVMGQIMLQQGYNKDSGFQFIVNHRDMGLDFSGKFTEIYVDALINASGNQAAIANKEQIISKTREISNEVSNGLFIKNENPGFFKRILSNPVGALIAGIATGGLATAAATAAGLAGTAAAATAGAATGATLTGLAGGSTEDILKGALAGGITGGAFGSDSALTKAVTNNLGEGAVGQAAVGALKSGISAGVTGGDVEKGLIKGAIVGGAKGALSKDTPDKGTNGFGDAKIDGEFDVDEYTRKITGISGTDTTGSDFDPELGGFDIKDYDAMIGAETGKVNEAFEAQRQVEDQMKNQLIGGATGLIANALVGGKDNSTGVGQKLIDEPMVEPKAPEITVPKFNWGGFTVANMGSQPAPIARDPINFFDMIDKDYYRSNRFLKGKI